MARRVLFRATVLSLASSMLIFVGPMTASYAAAPACADAESTAAAAAAMAKACQRSVEDMSLRTESSTTVHNADGTQRLTRYVEPRYAHNSDGTWGAVDTTLRVVNGRVAPARTVLPVSFSAGGTTALARVGHGKGAYELALQWSGPLPAPTLSGDTATYPEAYPGVDLRVTANATGFSEVLVVKNREAAANRALTKIAFGLATKGVTVASRADGSSEARNGKGEEWFLYRQALLPTISGPSGT